MSYEDKVQQINGPPQWPGSKKDNAERRDLPQKNTPPMNTCFALTAIDCGSRMTSMAVWRPINNPFEQQEDNHTTVCDRNHRNYLPQTPLSNSSASPSISLSPHCSLNRPSGISKTNNIPVPCRSNKLVSEYLPDMPPLRIRSQRYVAASNSRAKS